MILKLQMVEKMEIAAQKRFKLQTAAVFSGVMGSSYLAIGVLSLVELLLAAD